MAQNVIAVICDCDGTLCPDTASRLVSELGLDPQGFWREVAGLVEGGWDPPLAQGFSSPAAGGAALVHLELL